MKKYDCIFTGGAARGLSYVGVFKALEELEIEIGDYAGSSIGAVMMSFHALGYGAKEIEREVNETDMLSLFRDFNINILSDFAFSKGEIYLSFLREKIEKKFYGSKYKRGKMLPVKFKDTQKNLIIFATDLEAGEIKIFSKEHTPETEIALALRASSAMPGLIKPVLIYGKKYIDGDILRGIPLFDYTNFSKESSLEFRLTGGKRNKPSKNPIKYVNSIVNAAAYATDSNAVKKIEKERKIIQIDIEGVDFTDFKFTKEQKQEIYRKGYDTVIKYFIEH